MQTASSIYAVVAASLFGAMLAGAVAAAAQQPSFDGTYTGTPVPGTGSTYCNVVKTMAMTISGGQVTIRSLRVTGRDLTYRGNVTRSGEISAAAEGSGASRGRVFTVKGTIRGNLFTGDIVNNRCYSTVQLIKR